MLSNKMLGRATDFLMTSPHHREMLSQHFSPISQMRKPKHGGEGGGSLPKVTEATRESYRDQTPSSGSLCTSVHCILPSDAAFLAREKAKADAECYTAMKMAEANKVNKCPGPPGKENVCLSLCWYCLRVPGVGRSPPKAPSSDCYTVWERYFPFP